MGLLSLLISALDPVLEISNDILVMFHVYILHQEYEVIDLLWWVRAC